MVDSADGLLASAGHDQAPAWLEVSPDPLMMVHQDGTILAANLALEELFGYSCGELAGGSVDDLLPEALRARHRGLRRAFNARPQRRAMGGIVQHLEGLRRDGHRFPVEVSLAPASVGGRLVVVAAVRDISSRRALEQRERLIADLLDIASDAVTVIDVATRRQVYVNQAALDQTGLTREQLDTLPLGVPATVQEGEKLLATERAVTAGPSHQAVIESYARGPDGRSVPVELRLTYQPSAKGLAGGSGADGPETGDQPQGHLILVSREITERRRVEAERERRRAVSEAIATVRLAVLSGSRVPECLNLICAKALELLDGTFSGITLNQREGIHAGVAAVGGNPDPGSVVGLLFPIAGAVEEPVLRDGQPLTVLIGGESDTGRPPWMPAGADGLLLVAPMRDSRGVIGALGVARASLLPEFDRDDVDTLTEFAFQAAMAIEYGRLRADQERKDLLEERERIARDLHDTVIQDLFATGMLLDGTQTLSVDPTVSDRIGRAVDNLDDAIRALRSVVFLIDPPASSGSAAELLRRVLDSRAEHLGFSPTLQISGDLNKISARVMAELVQVANEALSNVARHAGATRAAVRVEVNELGAWALEVRDDGSGFRPGRVPLGRGLLNLGTRAELLAADLQVESRPGDGTTVRISGSPATPG